MRVLISSARIQAMQVLVACLLFLLLDQAAAQLSNPLANNKHISASGNKFLERTAAPTRKNWPCATPNTPLNFHMLGDRSCYAPFGILASPRPVACSLVQSLPSSGCNLHSLSNQIDFLRVCNWCRLSAGPRTMKRVARSAHSTSNSSGWQKQRLACMPHRL